MKALHRAVGIFLSLQLLSLQTSVNVAAATAPSPASVSANVWSSSGGQTIWYLNQDLFVPLGIKIESADKVIDLPQQHSSAAYRQFAFAGTQQSALEFAVQGKRLSALRGGSLQHTGGFVLTFPGGNADLRGFALQTAPGSDLGMQVVDRAGHVWFGLDHSHYALSEDGRTLSLKNMNLRLSSQFAAAMGRPEFANMVVGALDSMSAAHAPLLTTTVSPSSAELPMCTATYAWQSPSNPTDIALIYGSGALTGGVPDQINFERCKIPDGSSYTNCTPDSTNGLVVLAPDASLQNLGHASVAWNEMFNLANNGKPQPPYDNDQHPYLVWNLYRVDAGGKIKQIGVSAAKHAFYSVNYQCGCNAGNAPSVLYPTCQDNYSGATNDFEDYLGPRHEIVPSTGQWGRCGSIFDPTCSGNGPDLTGPYGSVDPDRHMVVLESDITPTLNSGAQYYFEYWYVVRDQTKIYDSMGFRAVTNFHKVLGGDGISSIWQFDVGELIGGPYLNVWAPPPQASPALVDNIEINTPQGRARIAVRTESLGKNMYHYDYAVMNLNFSHDVIDPQFPTDNLAVNPHGLKLLANQGFNRFTVPLAKGVHISNPSFADADNNAANDWVSTIMDGEIAWQAPAGNELNWGTLYTFGFDADRSPNLGSLAVNAATSSGSGASTYAAITLAPVAFVAPTFLPALGLWGLLLVGGLILICAVLRRCAQTGKKSY